MPVGAFVLGDPSDAKRFAKLLAHGEPTGGAELDGMALIDLWTLADLLMPGLDEVTMLAGVQQVSSGTTISLPRPFVERLASLHEHTIEPLALGWAESEEFRGLIPADELCQLLKQVAGIAREAVTADANLLFINL